MLTLTDIGYIIIDYSSSISEAQMIKKNQSKCHVDCGEFAQSQSTLQQWDKSTPVYVYTLAWLMFLHTPRPKITYFCWTAKGNDSVDDIS